MNKMKEDSCDKVEYELDVFDENKNQLKESVIGPSTINENTEDTPEGQEKGFSDEALLQVQSEGFDPGQIIEVEDESSESGEEETTGSDIAEQKRKYQEMQTWKQVHGNK